eukprot:15432776-Alexandrium_andersonii.AAC.1
MSAASARGRGANPSRVCLRGMQVPTGRRPARPARALDGRAFTAGASRSPPACRRVGGFRRGSPVPVRTVVPGCGRGQAAGAKVPSVDEYRSAHAA